MNKHLSLWATLITLFAVTTLFSSSMAAVFHVTNAAEFQNALTTAQSNGEDDSFYLAAGSYTGNFSYRAIDSEHRSLFIQGEWGTRAEDIILDGQNLDKVLTIRDQTDHNDGYVAYILVSGITVQNGNSLLYAGGIYADLSAYNIYITNCIVRKNSGTIEGGGVYMMIRSSDGGTLALENNLILDNVVTETGGISWGGGAFVFGNFYGPGTIVIRNNVIVGNIAQGNTDPQGGGLWVGWCYGNTTYLIGNTVYGNQANKGGGVYFGYLNSADVYNNIIYGNTATEGGDIYFNMVTTSNGYNNNYSDMFGTWTDSGSNLNTDPLFVDPANDDFHLQASSPMIDAGTTSVPDPPGYGFFDFEGNPRYFVPDIGAYEFSPTKPSYGTIGTVFTITGLGFGTSKGKVLIGNVAPRILEWTDSSIRCQVVKCPPFAIYEVVVLPKGGPPITVDHGFFWIVSPAIFSFDPPSGSANDEILIRGNNFGTKKGKVTLGGKNCKVLSWTMDPATGESEIRFVVPKGLSPGVKDLSVINSVGTDTRNFTVE